MGSKKDLKDYISGGFSGAGFMSFVRDNIRYIYDVGEVKLADSSTHNAHLIGIYAVGVFYSLSPEYDSAGKNLMQELDAFEQLYNSAFGKQLNRYSAQNPIGGKTSVLVELRLKEFGQNRLQNMAFDLIFGSLKIQDKPVDHSYFEPLFLRYLLLGNKSIDDAVKADINEHADELNFTLISEDMAYKRAAEMLRDEGMLKKISLYGKIKQTAGNDFIISVGFEGAVINNISIEKEQLLRMIKNDESFTYKEKLIIKFPDVIAVEHGKQVLYSI